MKVTLIKFNNKPITLCVDTFCFPIEFDVVMHNENSRLGSEYLNQLDRYDEAFTLADLAWKIQEFDQVISRPFRC